MPKISQREAERVNRPFVGIPSFLRAPICNNLDELNADIAVLGVPTDEGSPFMPGTRFGPRSIREQSLRFYGSGQGLYNPENGQPFLEREMSEGRLVDVGDIDIWPTNVAGTFENITTTVRRILHRGAMPVVIGGDHAISYPIVRGFEESIHVLHLDAHTDYSPFSFGMEMTNGQAFRHIRQMPHVQSLNQVGIRGLRTPRVNIENSRADGNRVVTIGEFRKLGLSRAFDNVKTEAKCYVSIDIDVLDMSLVPGCVSAEPDGMSYRDLSDTLQYIAEQFDVVGFDLVEVNPQLDVGTGATSYLASYLILEFIGYISIQPRWQSRRKAIL